jgi:hypothetical protein
MGVITSAIALSPYSIALQSQSTLAKSKSQNLLFASEKNFKDVRDSIKYDTPTLEKAKKAVEDN